MASDAAHAPPPASLYVGRVRHGRTGAVRHSFTYRIAALWLDLDRLGADLGGLRLLGYNRRGLMSFHDSDHGDGEPHALRRFADAALSAAGITLDPAGTGARGRVFLLTMPRLWGYVFNPLSTYYAYDSHGALAGLIYEVGNTFGERHWYVLGPQRRRNDGGLDQGAAKRFFVSPFLDMAARYRFQAAPPGERLGLTITHDGVDGRHRLHAAMTARRRPLTDSQLLRTVARMPVMTHKVIAAIHWEALKLWRKGAPYHAHRTTPRPSTTVSGSVGGLVTHRSAATDRERRP